LSSNERASSTRGRAAPLALVVLGALLVCGYVAWLVAQPRGLFEFAYAPFSPEPLPYSPMRGFTYEQLWGHVARAALVTPGLALVSWGLWRLAPLVPPESFRRQAFVAAAASVGVAAFAMFFVFRDRAAYDDELVYRMQATFLTEGRLGSHDIGVVPPDFFTVRTLAGYTGKYLPGEALVQVPGVLVGLAPLLHLPLFALTLVAWYRALFLRSGARIAELGTLALALSPMVMLTSATGLSQPTSLCMVALGGLGFEWVRSHRPVSGAALLGAAVAFGFATRPQTMLPVGAVFVPWAAVELARRRRFGALALLAAVLAAGFGAVGAYNAALTGSPLTLPWYLQCTAEAYGFGRVWKLDLYEHTPVTALENLLVVALRLNAWWLGFPCSLAVLGLWFAFGRKAHGGAVWLAVGAAIVVFELGYYSPGVSDTGTAYHYELVLPGSLIAASVAAEAFRRLPALAATSIAVHVVFGTFGWLGEQTLRLTRLVAAIHDDADRALASVAPPALVFYERRGSETRPLGWVHDPFPKRWRGVRDPIVTFPHLGLARGERIRKAYPGRACYYYRRNPRTEASELRRCDDARELMARDVLDEERALWVRPTAYQRTDFDPARANRERRVLDAEGRPLLPCCAVRDLRELGLVVRPELAARCVVDGP
jgi:hypothetical protein